MAVGFGDEVQLRGFITVGRVVEVRLHADGRWFTVQWHQGGFHAAPERDWIPAARTAAWEKVVWWGGGIALVVLLLIGLAVSAGQAG